MHHCATVATLPNMIPYIYVAHIGIKILRPLATPKIIGLDCQKALKYTNRLARVRRLRGAIFPLVYTIWTQNLVHMLSKDILSSPVQVEGGGQTASPLLSFANNSLVYRQSATNFCKPEPESSRLPPENLVTLAHGS